MPVALGTVASHRTGSTAPSIPMTGLWGWWAADVDADFVDAGGGKVSKWKDHTGNTTKDAIAYGGSTLVARGGSQNGHKFCTFYATGPDTIFYASLAGSVPPDNISVFAVARTRDTAARRGYIGWGNTLLGHAFSPGNYGVYLQYSDGLISGGSELINTWSLQGHIRDAGTIKVRRDGVQVATSTGTPVGGELWIGGDYYPEGYKLNSDVAEVVAYNRVLTGPEIAQVESYLKAKWFPPPPFPLTINWSSAFWASDPLWVPPADGGGMSTWRNGGSSGTDAQTVYGSPTYRASYANLGNCPAITTGFPDGAWGMMDASWSVLAQPNHVFVVGWLDPTAGGSCTIFDGFNADYHRIRNRGTGGVVEMNGGTAAGAGRYGAFAVAALFNGTSSQCRMNGTSYSVDSSVGTLGISQMRMFTDTSAQMYKGALAFVGVKDSALTPGELSALESWAASHYGVPIA